MGPIVIATELGPDDWRELLAYVGRRYVAAQAWRFRILTLGGIGLAGVVALSLIHLAGGKPDGISYAVGVVVAALSFVGIQRLYARHMAAAGRAFLGPSRIELDEHGFRTVRAGMTSAVDWNRVQQIDETPTAIYLALDERSAFVIPKRSVDPAQLPELVAQLRAWHAERTRTSLNEPAPGFEPPSSVRLTREAGTSDETLVSARRSGFFRALAGNLRAGFKLLTFRKVAPTEFTVSFDQLVALLAIALALITGVDWLLADPDAELDPYGYYVWTYYILAGLWAAALIARLQGSQANTRALLVTWLASVPGVIVVLGLVLLLPMNGSALAVVLGIAALVLFVLSERAVRNVFGFARLGTSVLIVLAVAGVPWFFQMRLQLDPQLWVVPESEQDMAKADDTEPDDAESLLFDQADRIADAVDATAAQRPGVVDTYFVGFAGWGAQKVFRNEALFGERVLAKRFNIGRRAIELINDQRDRDTYPLATATGLRYALQLLGEKMDPDEDMLVLLLTSHGSRESGIAVRNGGLPLMDLAPDELRSALDDSGIKWRIVIVSACYSGIFVEPLKSDSTLVITAADPDHTSFGCADDRDLTYFGEAFLRDALPGAPSLEAAFAKARDLIAQREKQEHLTPSHPQMFVGDAIRQKLTLPVAPTDDTPDVAIPGTTLTARAVVRPHGSLGMRRP
ncbi:MAG TPA: C13 family peptidase [Steroidobacteraceae bacterium]|nr:C13 family peptidase [Steroidobacteraceae bacterium]